MFWDCKSVEVTMTGGYLFPRIGVLLGPVCDDMLTHISADILVMGMLRSESLPRRRRNFTRTTLAWSTVRCGSAADAANGTAHARSPSETEKKRENLGMSGR